MQPAMPKGNPVAGDNSAAEGRIGRIPVRNLWLLMLYASDLFRTSGIGKVGLEDNSDELPDLVAEILAHAVEKQLRGHLTLLFALHPARHSRR